MSERVVNDIDHEEMENAKPEVGEKRLKDKKVSWGKLRRVDSLHMEAGRLSFTPSHGSKVDWRTTLILAFQSIGVVYGDIGTSPLYVYASTFTDGIKNQDDILGVLSLIIYTILLVPVVKYAFIVLSANDNGDGGTFALYSLLCRYARISLIPNQQPEDMELSNYSLETPSTHMRRAYKIKQMLEKSRSAKMLLFIVTILGTSMVIGDGVLTPSISVISAVSGIGSLGKGAVVWISVAILVILFSVQRFGTDKVGYSFAPIICLWFTFISGIGLYNLFKHDVGVLRAFNPKYIVDYFVRNGKTGWISLGGIVLCITGTEAMFADLGHFNVRAIQVSFSGLVLPALLSAYAGQAAYLRKFPQNVSNTFYDSIPDSLYWPTFVVAVAAAIIASQAMISGAFAIVSQSLSLSCFPRVKVVHTSAKYEGQVYIPEVNYILMIACVIVTVGFQTTEKIGHAYGIAVVAVMVITTCLVALIMLLIWKTSIWWIGLFFVVFMSIELIYFSAVLYKFVQGGYLPLGFSFFLMIVMGIWHYVQKQRYMFELNNKVSSEFIHDLAKNQGLNRVPGIGLLYSELVQGIPPIFTHFIANVPSIHFVLVCVSIKSIPISHVALEERFLFRQVEPREYRMFRCIVRYGYKDHIEEPEEFERQLVEHLKQFIRHEHYILEGDNHHTDSTRFTQQLVGGSLLSKDTKTRLSSSSPRVHIEESMQEATQVTQQLANTVPKLSNSSCEARAEESGQELNTNNPSRASSGSIRSFNATKSFNSLRQIVSEPKGSAEEEIQFVQQAAERGVVYLMGETEVAAKPNSSLFKKFVVNYAYSFLRKNFRQGDKVLAIPRARLLRVGMTYEI